jgi:ubiquinone biosynthesis protein UbiJ
VTVAQLLPEGASIKWIRHLLYPGAAGIMLAITLSFIKLLGTDPAAGTELLRGWGPGFVLGLLALVVVGAFLDKMVDAQRSSVDAQQKVAVALTQLAERDDRDRDRMVTETQYMAQRMDQTHALVTSVAAQLSRIEMKLAIKDTGD